MLHQLKFSPLTFMPLFLLALSDDQFYCNNCNSTSTALSGDQRPTCVCKTGCSYCGHKLQEMGYDGYDNDTLYECSGGNEMTVLSKCPPGTCQSHYCKCNPGQYYCGSQLLHKTSAFQNSTLWKCWPDGILLTISSYDCRWGCKSNQDNHSYCLCKENSHYCGHQLKDLGWQGYQDHSLYKCDGGLNASLIENCQNQCDFNPHGDDDDDGENQDLVFGRCSSHCKSGRNYCGYRLKEEHGWDGYENDTLYHCRGGNETTVWSKCPPGTCQLDHCNCNPDQYYCGHELYEQLGWKNFKSRRMELQKCVEGTTTFYTALCNQCNSTSTALSVDQRPICECITNNTYCGYRLQEMGWDEYEINTLYICEEGQHIRKLMACGEECRFDRYCECTPNKLYCGHELYQMGWKDFKSKQMQLLKCAPYKFTILIAECNQCNNTSTALSVSDDQHPTCECVTGNTYCGNTLQTMGYDGFDNDTLYVCEKGDNFSKLMVCGDGKCLGNHCECTRDKLYCGHELYPLGLLGSAENQARLGRCAYGSKVEWISFCNQCNSTPTALTVSSDQRPTCECITNNTYCGYTLHAMGYDGYDNSTLYICDNGQNIRKLMVCGNRKCRADSYCECTEDKLYCGHELYEMGWKDFKSRQMELHKCNPSWMGGRSTTWIAFCNRCNSTRIALNDDQRPTCECKTGSNYCGYGLLEMGYDGYDDHAFYVCEEGQNIRKLKACRFRNCYKTYNSYECDD